jgi:hypothetical protein
MAGWGFVTPLSLFCSLRLLRSGVEVRAVVQFIASADCRWPKENQQLSRGEREAAFLGDRDEIAKAARFHAMPYACEVWRQAYKVLFHRTTSTQLPDRESDGMPSR